jgi:hypothetical protein
MPQAYQIEMNCETFKACRDQFDAMVKEIQSDKALRMEHGQIEKTIRQMGNELMRLFMQAHLDLRAMSEPRRHDLKGSEGKALTHCRQNCECDLMTIFGEVAVKRKGYSAAGEKSLFPLDGALNLAEDKYSHGLRCRVAEEVAGKSFDEAVATIKETTGGKVPKRQVEELAVCTAQDFDGFYLNRETQGPEPADDILVMTVDQKGVVMRKEDLRPATRKAAEKAEEHRPGARLNPGEKRDRKRMATVAAVYSIEARERSPEEVMGLCSQEEKSNRPRGRNKRVWASVEQEPEEVIQAMLDEALRRDPDKLRPWAVLLDGGEKQLDVVLDLIYRNRPDVTLVLDFIHVLEYVWKAAYGFYAVGSKEAADWVAERALKILQGKAGSVAASLRESLHQLRAEKRKAVVKCADYLEKYDALLDYGVFLKEGIPIATGVIEGACRHLIKDRMDLTGARWRLKRAEAVLRIRSLKSSGDWHEYFMFHQARERERNHSYSHAA